MTTHRIAVVTCYRDPEYVRAVTLRAAIGADPALELIVVKNSARDWRRYFQVLGKLLRLRFSAQRPDAYLVTFRGFEILPVTLLLAGDRPVVFDEFVNPIEWFVFEHHKLARGSILARLLRQLFRRWSLRSRLVLTDTATHAKYSSQLMRIDPSHYLPVPVGSDEATFFPRPRPVRPSDSVFVVLYYGSMLPLHGLDRVLDAALMLSDRHDILFRLVGGDAETVALIGSFRARGARIQYESWIDYAELPASFDDCDLFLAGPFGNTVQSQHVITGKTFQFLSSALPTVVGANGETSVFTDRVDALVVPQGSSSALVDSIVWAATHRTELAEIGRRGRELYDQRYGSVALSNAVAQIDWGFTS